MMKLLLDTHVLLWAAGQPELLSEQTREMLSDAKNELCFSAASLWEIAIKNSLHRPDFKIDAHMLRRGLIDNGYEELSISGTHAVAVSSLPLLHKDPFDRILVAQAVIENITLVTADSIVAQYAAPIHFLS